MRARKEFGLPFDIVEFVETNSTSDKIIDVVCFGHFSIDPYESFFIKLSLFEPDASS